MNITGFGSNKFGSKDNLQYNVGSKLRLFISCVDLVYWTIHKFKVGFQIYSKEKN